MNLKRQKLVINVTTKYKYEKKEMRVSCWLWPPFQGQ